MDQPLPQDFREFLSLLDAEKIEYLLVGGYAVSYHGYPRSTGDLDVWIATTPQNAARLVTALVKFGFGSAGATQDTFLAPDRIVRMGHPPVRIEIMSTISGVSFAECYPRRVKTVIDNVPVTIIAKSDLIANKRAAGRAKDLADVTQLTGRPSA